MGKEGGRRRKNPRGWDDKSANSKELGFKKGRSEADQGTLLGPEGDLVWGREI